jgi:hypothetical protein
MKNGGSMFVKANEELDEAMAEVKDEQVDLSKLEQEGLGKAKVLLEHALADQRIVSQDKMAKAILEFNRDYMMIPDKERGFRREGQKDVVDVELRVFNGTPQVVVFYGKTRYTYNIFPRNAPDRTSALMKIMGYSGVDSLTEECKAMFPKEALDLRKRSLKQRGV